MEGLKHLGDGHISPDTFDVSVVDQMIDIDVDASYEMSHSLSAKGMFAGQSSGAYLWAASEIADTVGKGHIVTIINDIGERYFSTGMWDKIG